MKVTPELVDHLAHLARLEFNAEEKTKIMADLERIIGFVEKLQEVNTDGVEPLVYISDEQNVMRADVAQDTISKQDALSNAPVKDSDYFKVPKFVD
jgi:aspartyl-tRNA(Asn)/glutamyl-tRNA(Gln) amidotransferase subunit C